MEQLPTGQVIYDSDVDVLRVVLSSAPAAYIVSRDA